MPAKPIAPKLFDVLPQAQMRQALRQAMPEGTKLVWKLAGKLDITSGALGVVDAGSCHPWHIAREAKALAWPYPIAELWLQVSEELDGRDSRVFAAMIAAPGEQAAAKDALWQTREAASMAIDSATAVVADRGRLLSCCRLGGPLSGVALGKAFAEGAVKVERERAATWLAEQGFPNRVEQWHGGSISVKFVPGLSEEQAAAANVLLKKQGFAEEVRIYDAHTSGQIGEALRKSLFTEVDDGASPFLFAFHTGFGDGNYYWDALECDGKLCGYLCNFVPEDAE